MRLLIVALCGGVLLAGCAVFKGTNRSPGASDRIPDPAKTGQPVVKPDLRPVGRVALVNRQGRFVVMTFPRGTFPEKDHKVSVYRQGLKVGEVKVTEQTRDLNIVGDLMAGEAQVNDEVREN